MKPSVFLSVLAVALISQAAWAQKGTLVFPTPAPTNPPAPPPIYLAPAPVVSGATIYESSQQTYVYDQKLFSGASPLVTDEQRKTILDRFKSDYAKVGSPRILIYVNRDLVDQRSGLKLTHRKEHSESIVNRNGDGSPTSVVKTTSDNNYVPSDKAQPTLADRQTVRDVERLFGRPLREAGASLVDQRVASEVMADKAIGEVVSAADNPQAQKDRDAIKKVADVVIEVLISSKDATVPTISGSQSVVLPDIQATAIRLSDSRIVGQASSSDITDRVSPAALGGYGVQAITDATALALMDDMTATAAKQ